MKKFWKILAFIGGAIGAVFLFIIGRRSAQNQNFKEDLEDNKEKIKDVKEKIVKVEIEKKQTKQDIASKKKDINKTKEKLNTSKDPSSEKIIKDFKKKYKKN
jgi:uncharacterized membrane protein YgaE (UPF0421/DUF939 family)